MADDGGVLLIKSTSVNTNSTEGMMKNRSRKSSSNKPTPLLDAAMLDRLAKFKISDDDQNDDNNNNNNNEKKKSSMISRKSIGGDESANSSMSFTSSSSGIGSGELSPTLTTSKDYKTSFPMEKSSEKLITSDQLDRRSSTGVVGNIEKLDGGLSTHGKYDRDDQHAKSLTLPGPMGVGKKSGKSVDPSKILRSGGQKVGGHLSPAEFFQMSRLRASALANKLNTSATYGGSRDLVAANGAIVGESTKKEDEIKVDDAAVDELIKAVEGVKLEKKTEDEEEESGDKENVEEKEEQEPKKTADGELIGRSPVPVHSSNRHIQHPYRQAAGKYPTPQMAPMGYCTPKGPDGSPMTPGDYMHQQRMRANGQYVAQQMGTTPPPPPTGQPQYNMMAAHQPGQMAAQHGGNYGVYQSQQQQYAAPDHLQQHQQQQQNVYSPTGGVGGYHEYANNNEQAHRGSANGTPRSITPTLAWTPMSQDSMSNMGYVPPPGSCSPMSAISADDGQATMANGQQQQQGQMGYAGAISPFEDRSINDDLNRFLQQQQQSLLQKPSNERHMADKNVDELPEALCDFILKYSRRYSTSSSSSTAKSSSGHGGNGNGGDGASSGCVSGEPSPMSVAHRRSSDSSLSSDESGVEDDHDMASQRPDSTETWGRPDSCQSASSGVFLDSSPQSIGSACVPANSSSPAHPVSSELTKLDESSDVNSQCSGKYRTLRPKQPTQEATQPPQVGKARQHLRELIPQHEFDSAWAWAMRCCQACPGSLMFRDVDGDSLLHIVVWHKDLAKIYAITEILMKDDQPASTKPIDMPNKLDETPLFLAVEKRTADVVAYLIECGANPNLRARNHDGDGPLHYAAARGMSEIVQLFCTSTKTNFNLLNGSGMTPLLCAVKNHGVIEEESQCLVNNKPTIRTLLKAGADPKIPDVASGKSVLHYCVERMDPDLVELFRDHLTKDSMSQLVNMPDYNGDTPLHILSRMVGESAPRSASQFARAEGEGELRRKMLNTLIDCGADVSQSAGGLGGNAGGGGFGHQNGNSYVTLYADPEDNTDDIQFTILDTELTTEAF